MYVLLPVITPHRGLVRFLNAAPKRIIPTTRLPAAPPSLHTGSRVEALHTTGREREHHQEGSGRERSGQMSYWLRVPKWIAKIGYQMGALVVWSSSEDLDNKKTHDATGE